VAVEQLAGHPGGVAAGDHPPPATPGHPERAAADDQQDELGRPQHRLGDPQRRPVHHHVPVEDRRQGQHHDDEQREHHRDRREQHRQPPGEPVAAT